MIRKAVPLSPPEVALVGAVRRPGTQLHDALVATAGPDAARSEAATLHALVTIGLEALTEAAAGRGYAELVDSMDDEDRAYRDASRARRRSSA